MLEGMTWDAYREVERKSENQTDDLEVVSLIFTDRISIISDVAE